ncbi:MAG: arylsulfatase, partial [Novosphingobium sp.]
MEKTGNNSDGRRQTRRPWLAGLSRPVLGIALGLTVSSIPIAGAVAQQTDQTGATQGRSWPNVPVPSRSAPNVLLIMTDDVGFSATSTFGGLIPTPHYDRLAKQGARYNQFNTTALCSPTRASLLTGRMPHNVEMGNVTNLPTGYEGYTSVMPDNAATIAQILRENGYATAMFGKWHLTPEWEKSSIGPFKRWPSGKGFDYFYGFDGGDTDQFAPALFENNIAIAPPTDDPDYILDNDLATRAINWIRQKRELAPDHPFFVYIAPGTAHAPHSAPQAWLEKFRGKFDQGWDKVREQTFLRQKAAGLLPANAELTPRPDFLPAWDSLSPDHKRLFARMMEAYAAALAYNDDQLGRVFDSLRDSGEMDNTLVIFIQGDNGASAEGGKQGLFSEEAFINGYPEDFDWLLKHIDEIGGPKAHNHFPAAWAWAMNTPFQYYKQVASHNGGVRNGLVISWPGHIAAPDRVRQQYLHVSDIAPTIMEAAGITLPKVVDGVPQMPFDGISFAYTFRQPVAEGKRHAQVFEMMQNLAVYNDGWVAGTKPAAAPWDITTKSLDVDISARKWELYNLKSDYSQAHDLSASLPDKLNEMKAIFFEEAKKNRILPVHGIFDGAAGRPVLNAGRTTFTYTSPIARIPENGAPITKGRSFDIIADIIVPENGAKGVLATQGGRFGGYAFYLADGVPTFHYNMTGDMQYIVRGSGPVSPGKHILKAQFDIDKPEPGAA